MGGKTIWEQHVEERLDEIEYWLRILLKNVVIHRKDVSTNERLGEFMREELGNGIK